MTFIRAFLFSLLFAIPAFAQEPRTPIKPAEPIAAASHDVTAISSDCMDRPVIQPTPLPVLKISLGEYARQIRAQHVAAPKAAKITNNDRFDAEVELEAKAVN
jgi:NAD dependent epimerase/dehydratase family enzyme